MEISKEDQDRIEKDSTQYSANFDEYKAEQAEDDFFEGAIHEHLTQVLPLREELKSCQIMLSNIRGEKDREIDNLKTVMIAAAEEIQEHWQAHCDEEGYGPANLMRRLENGLPSQYGYTAGAFQSLKEENERLRALLKEVRPVIMRVGSKTLIEIDTLLTETKKP